MRRFAPYAKLGVWGQTQWSKVLTLYPIPYTLTLILTLTLTLALTL